MGERDLAVLCQWKKQQMMKLMEVSDLTAQLADSVERRDQVAVSMYLTMREDPIRQAEELETQAQEHLLTLPPEEAARYAELLRGEPARQAEEEQLANQVAQNRRILQRVRDLDCRTSLSLGGKTSFYQKFRT